MSHASRLNAVALLAILLTSGLATLAPPALASHESVGGASKGTIHFTRLDQVPYPNGAQIQGTGASVMIVLQDSDLADPTFRVNVRSLSDATGEDITLRRVLLPSGTSQYHGFVGVETTLAPNNGNVFVRHGDRVTVVYFDADQTGTGVAGVSAHNLTWIETQNGKLTLDRADYFGLGEEAEILVEDADIPTATTHFCVHVTSDSDPQGFNMSLNVKVADGKYRGNLGFTAGASTNGWVGLPNTADCTSIPAGPPTAGLPRIRVQDGDLIYVNYTVQGFDQRGRLEDAEVWAVWHRAFSGRIQFVTSDFRQVVSENPNMPFANEAVFGTDAGRDRDSASAWLRVEDRDLTGRGAIRVNVRSLDPVTLGGAPGVDPTGIFVTLYETTDPRNPYRGRNCPTSGPNADPACNSFRSREYGQGSGEFIGFFSFRTEGSTPGSEGTGCDPGAARRAPCRLQVTENAIVVARYDDEHNANGDLQVVESRAVWHQSMTGTLRFKAGADGLHGTPQDPAHYTTDALSSRRDYNSTWVRNNNALACRPFSAPGTFVNCHWDRGYLELRDTDLRGRGNLTVTLRSNRDPLGVQLTMIEATVNGIVNSGVFRGSFGFNHTHSSDGELTWVMDEDQLIWARGCDDLEAVYFDTLTETGRTTTVTATYADVVAIRTNGGAPNCSASNVFHQNHVNETARGLAGGEESLTLHKTAAGGEVESVFYGYREAWVQLVDYEQNRTNRLDMTNRTLIVASTSYPAQSGWPTFQTVVNLGTHQLNVTMTERASGVFVGRFRFVRPGQELDTFPQLPVRDGDMVCAYWLYRNANDQPIQLLAANQPTRTSKPMCSIWRETHDPVVEFRSAPHQGASMNNIIGTGPEAAVFYNGTGKQWTYNEAMGQLETNQAWVYVRDIDLHADIDRDGDFIDVEVRSESHLDGIAVRLYETYGSQNFSYAAYAQNRTGTLPWATVYSGPCAATFGGGGTCTVQGVGAATRPFVSAQDDRGFMGVFNITRQLKLTPTGTFDKDWYDNRDSLYVQDGDTITAFYTDAYNSTGASADYAAFVDWHETHSASLSLDRQFYRNHPDVTNTQNRAVVTLRDRDLDTSVAQQTVTVRVYNNRTRTSIPVVLEETGPRTAEFKGEFCFLRMPAAPGPCAVGAGNGLPVADEDAFHVNYTDAHDVHGERVVRMDHGEWFDTTSTLLTLDNTTYAGYGALGRVRLEDVDLDTTSAADTVQVWVRSETDGSGELLGLTETGPRTRIFEGTLAFEETHAANNGKVQVVHGDEVTVHFFDRKLNNDNADTGVKSVKVVWEAAPNQPPRLTLTSLPPFNETLGAIPIHFSDDPKETEVIAFFPQATDADGRVDGFEIDFGDRSPRVVTVDRRGPSGQPILHAYAAEIFYEGFAQARDDDFQQMTMQVRFTAWDEDGARTTITRDVVLIKPDRDPPGGIRDVVVVPAGTKADAVLLEWTVPQNNENLEDNKAPSAYEVRYSGAAITTDEQWAAARVATDVVFRNPQQDNSSTLAAPVPGQTPKQRAEVRGLEALTTYFFAVRAKDDDPVEWRLGRDVFGQGTLPVTREMLDTVHAIGYVDQLNVTADTHVSRGIGDFDGTAPGVTTLRADTTPPVGTLNIKSSTHQRNVPSEDRQVRLSWNPASQFTAGSSITFRYQVTNTSVRPTLTPSTGTAVLTNTTTLTLGLGTHYFHLAACSLPGCNTGETFGPIVIADGIDDGDDNVTVLTPDDILAYNERIEVTVTREGSDNVVRWTLPSSPPATVEGVQIWRATSPFRLLVDLDASTDEFEARRYVDAGAPETARYVVTAYYGPSAALGFGDADGDPADIVGGVFGFDELEPATVEPTGDDGAEEGTLERLMGSWWFWLLVGLGVLLLLGIVVGVVVMSRRGGDEDDGGMAADEGMGWGGATAAADSGEEEWPEVGGEGGTAVEAPPQESYAIEPPAPVAPAPVAPAPPAKPEAVEDRLTHHLTCPSCGAAFTAHGQKPMVTECPSCGVKGVLR